MQSSRTYFPSGRMNRFRTTETRSSRARDDKRAQTQNVDKVRKWERKWVTLPETTMRVFRWVRVNNTASPADNNIAKAAAPKPNASRNDDTTDDDDQTTTKAPPPNDDSLGADNSNDSTEPPPPPPPPPQVEPIVERGPVEEESGEGRQEEQVAATAPANEDDAKLVESDPPVQSDPTDAKGEASP